MLMLYLGASFLFAFAQATSSPTPTSQPAAAPALPQVAPPAPPKDAPTPSDPKERLELADKVNGLRGLDIPWHLKASYEVFAPDGSSKDKGTYEEWWKDAKQYKVVFHSPAVSVEEYGTDHGTFRSDGQDFPGRPLSLLQETIQRPVPPRANPEKVELKNYQRSFGAGKAPCTALIDRGGNETTENAASFCFAPTNAVVFYTSSPYRRFQALLEHIVLVHGHYLAYDVQWFLVGKLWLKVHIDSLEAFAPSDAMVMTVPTTALPVSQRAGATGSITAGRLVNKAVPQYPSEAKQLGVQGEVLLSAIIGEDGHIKKIEVLAGPPMLQQPAVDAVRKWVYQPYLLDGRPVEVETDISVVFNLAR